MPQAIPESDPIRLFSGRFQAQDLDLPVNTLLRMQGYRDMERVRPRIRTLAESALDEAAPLLQSDAFFRCLPVQSRDPASVLFADRVSFRSSELAKILEASDYAIVFTMTAGAAIDALVDRVSAEGDMALALFMDTVGWLAVERATHALAQELSHRAQSHGLRLTRRLAPGYADWPLEEQAGLFALLDAKENPVTLLESGAMLPKKSRSGLYGLRSAAAPQVPAMTDEQTDGQEKGQEDG